MGHRRKRRNFTPGHTCNGGNDMGNELVALDTAKRGEGGETPLHNFTPVS